MAADVQAYVPGYRLKQKVQFDHIEGLTIVERPLTLFLNGQEIVTMMTIGDHPDWLAIGYLLNQHMLRAGDELRSVNGQVEFILRQAVQKRRQSAAAEADDE